jgi:hypothetical protein
MMTNNKGLLTRITSCLLHIEKFPNLTLQADWDVTNEIAISIQELAIPPVLRHVKGHQDSHTDYASLPLNAQLNVDANAEAGYYQCLHPKQRPIIPRLPSNRVQLHLDGKVIKSKLKKRIREAFTVPSYLCYLQKRFQWTDACVDNIDWLAYTQAIGRFSTRQIQITKLCNDLLPTARWVNRYDLLTTSNCFHCGKSEDRDHILRCKHVTRAQWQNDLLVHLRQAHGSTKSDPQLLDMLIDGLHSWFQNTSIHANRYPIHYRRLINKQTDIGWRHMFNGHITSQ